MRPSRSLMSWASSARASTAMISDATAISKPASRPKPVSLGPFPVSTRRKKRSHVSKTRFHVMVDGSTSSRANETRSSADINSASSSAGPVTPNRSNRARCEAAGTRFPSFSGMSRLNKPWSVCLASWNMRASSAAATKLFAATIAWMSPVMCKLNSSMGMTWE